MESLVAVSELNRELIFSDKTGEMNKLLEKIEKHAKSLVFDVETNKGRAEIASLAHKVRKSKTAIEAMGKEYATELKEKSNIVDGERKKMRDTLDLLRDEVRAPLTEYENREKERIEKIEARIKHLETMLDGVDDYNLEQLRTLLIELNLILIDDSFGEFKGQAERAHHKTKELLTLKVTARENYEAQQVELKRLRDAETKRVRAAEDEKIRVEAAAEATRKTEAKAKLEAEAEAKKVNDARIKLEAEKLAAEQEKVAAQEREKLEKERAEKAEADKIAAEKQAIIDKENTRKQAEIDKAQAIKAAQADAKKKAYDKIEREKRDEEKRKADEANHKKVNNEAKDAIFAADDIVSDEAAKEIVKLIAMGKIPHVFIRY